MHDFIQSLLLLLLHYWILKADMESVTRRHGFSLKDSKLLIYANISLHSFLNN